MPINENMVQEIVQEVMAKMQIAASWRRYGNQEGSDTYCVTREAGR